jgi:hypothetical protein
MHSITYSEFRNRLKFHCSGDNVFLNDYICQGYQLKLFELYITQNVKSYFKLLLLGNKYTFVINTINKKCFFEVTLCIKEFSLKQFLDPGYLNSFKHDVL